jgi:hypothetical protein
MSRKISRCVHIALDFLDQDTQVFHALAKKSSTRVLTSTKFITNRCKKKQAVTKLVSYYVVFFSFYMGGAPASNKLAIASPKKIGEAINFYCFS